MGSNLTLTGADMCFHKHKLACFSRLVPKIPTPPREGNCNMKKAPFSLLVVCFLFFSSFINSDLKVYASADTIDIDDVVVALGSGNASQLSKYFDSRVDIGLPEKTDNYSKTQAEMVMRDFFSNNGVKNFQIKYKSEKAGTNYCVGTLKTKGGDYRTTLFMKQKGDKQYLQDISFQRIE